MKVYVLAAGYATRLHPLTLETPKPLLEVGGSPILTRILASVAALLRLRKCPAQLEVLKAFRAQLAAVEEGC